MGEDITHPLPFLIILSCCFSLKEKTLCQEVKGAGRSVCIRTKGGETSAKHSKLKGNSVSSDGNEIIRLDKVTKVKLD